MSFLAFCIVPLIFLSLIVRGLQPSVIRATNRRHSNERHTTSIGHGHFRRDLRQTTVISNDESTDGEIPCDNVFERKGPIESEADFVSYCEDWLLFFEKDRSNAFVSQGDLVDFLADVCTVFDEEDLPYFDCPAPTFTSIDQDVQIVFVKHLCGLKVGEEMVQCLKSIVDAGTEFGYHVDLTRSPLMEELCCGLIPFVSLVGLRQSTGKT